MIIVRALIDGSDFVYGDETLITVPKHHSIVIHHEGVHLQYRNIRDE